MKKRVNNKKQSQKQKPSIKGRGDYNVTSNEFAQLQSKLDKIEGKLPNVRGGLGGFGEKVGSVFGQGGLGRKLGEGAASLMGFGDYQVVSNSLMKNAEVSGALLPKFHSLNNGVRIREREYLGDVVSGTANTFSLKSYPITPTNPATFPWLSSLARQFDQWEPHGIVFEFVSTSSDFNGSAQGLGSIIMATDYDVLDAPFSNKIIMDNADYSSSTKPSVNMMHGIECDPKQRPYTLMYNRSLDRDPANNNTLGNFQIASSGVSATGVTLGELWVSYDVTFYKKQLDTVVAPSYCISGSYASTGNVWVTNTVLNLSGFSTVILATALNQLQVTFPSGITKGRFLVYLYETTATGPYPLTFLANSNATLVIQRTSVAGVVTERIEAMLIDVVRGGVFVTLAAYANTPYALSVTQVADNFSI